MDNTKRKPLLSREEKEEFTRQTFPFENIALEGGGSKGGSYVGTIRVSGYLYLFIYLYPHLGYYVQITLYLFNTRPSCSYVAMEKGKT